jgi:hypothetical protein
MSGRSFKDSIVAALQPLARAIPGGMALGRAVHRWVDPQRRAVHHLRQRGDIALFQPFPTTFDNRYGELFEALAERLSSLPAPRILSFGCSSGEEVRALRARIPSARITGMDINPHALEQARRAEPEHASDYVLSDRPCGGERYDAILAMAVFRHGVLEGQRPDSCAGVLPFAAVSAGIARLDAVLAPGGWLAIGNAHFRFCDMPEAQSYTDDPFRLSGHPPQELLYGPDDLRIDGLFEPVLFRKR